MGQLDAHLTADVNLQDALTVLLELQDIVLVGNPKHVHCLTEGEVTREVIIHPVKQQIHRLRRQICQQHTLAATCIHSIMLGSLSCHQCLHQ